MQAFVVALAIRTPDGGLESAYAYRARCLQKNFQYPVTSRMFE